MFPTEILLPIFVHLDDIGLWHIATINDRFDAIAQMVFERRYLDTFFIIEGENPLQEQYWTLFKKFGDSINAIQLNKFENMDKNHWTGKMIEKHTKSVNKLCFRDCTFCKSVTQILSQHMNITHLTIQEGPHESEDVLRLPEYQHLKKLELIQFQRISVRSLKRTICANPQLESLIFRFCDFFPTMAIIMDIVCNHLHHLKEFVLLEYLLDGELPPMRILNSLADSLRNIETLGISIDTESIELLRQLCLKCKNIKRLELYHVGAFENINTEMIRELRSLDKVEHFRLRQHSYSDEIELLVENFPHLRHLHFEMIIPETYDYISSLLRKNANLQTIINEQILTGDQPLSFMPMHFYDELVKMAGHRNFKVEFSIDGDHLLCVTEKEFIWRNKLMHWFGNDPVIDSSKETLLDLANNYEQAKTNRRSPFELILDLLDLNSLYSLSKTNRQANKLVEKYVLQRSVEEKDFIFTDEFQRTEGNYDGLRAFGPHVTCLKAIVLRDNYDELHSVISEYCKNLTFYTLTEEYYTDNSSIVTLKEN